MHRNVPFRLAAMTWSKSSSFMLISRPSLVMPALLTRISIRPNSCRAVSISRATCWGLDTSQRTVRALTPMASQAAAVCRAVASLPA